MNNIVHRALQSINIPSTLEPVGLDRQDGKRPDGMTLIPWSRGKCLVWDATVCDTFANSHVAATSVCVGAAANKAALNKENKYEYIAGQHHFIPIAIETMGSFSRSAFSFIQFLGSRLNVSKCDRQSGYL